MDLRGLLTCKHAPATLSISVTTSSSQSRSHRSMSSLGLRFSSFLIPTATLESDGTARQSKGMSSLQKELINQKMHMQQNYKKHQ